MIGGSLNREQLEFAAGPHGGDKMIGLASLCAGRGFYQRSVLLECAIPKWHDVILLHFPSFLKDHCRTGIVECQIAADQIVHADMTCPP